MQSDRDVPCAENNICAFTKENVYDPEALIIPPELVRIIADMWLEIVAISSTSKLEASRMRGKRIETVVKHLPSLEKIDFYLEMQDWDVIPLNKKDAFYYITMFHKEYLGVILGA